jgi:hypothetical protein
MASVGLGDQLCGETPTDLRMLVQPLVINFVGLSVTINETQRKAAIQSVAQNGRESRSIEERLETQPQRFAMLGINHVSYNAVMWASSEFHGPLNSWLLNRKTHGSIIGTFNSLVTSDIRKTTMLPNIRDDAITSLIGLTQGSLSYADYTQQFNDFIWRSRHPRTDAF